MQIFQKEQLSNKKTKADALDVLILLWIFSSALLKLVLYFFNIQSNSGQLAIIYIIVAVVSAFLCFKHFSRMITTGFLKLILLFVIIGVSFVISSVVYGTGEAKFVSEFKAYFAMAICTILLALIIVWRKKKDINLKAVFVAIILMTLISFLPLFRGDSVTSAGFVKDSSGLIYQNVSYFSAQSFGLTVFHITETRKIKPLSWLYKIVCFVLIAIQTITCFFSGGRGGFVLLVVLFITGVFSIFGKKAYKIVIPLAILILLFRYIVPRLVNFLDINLKGLDRMLSFLNGNVLGDGRTSMYQQSFEVFLKNPITGNGVGSIFHYLNSYSHNMVFDILAETGIVGLIILTFVFIYFIYWESKLYRQGSLFRFLTIIFICGFTLNLFSGYIWTNPFVWLPIAVAITVRKNEFEPDLHETISSDADVQGDKNSLEGKKNG